MDQPKRQGVCVCGGHENKHPALDRSLRLGGTTIPGVESAIADTIARGADNGEDRQQVAGKIAITGITNAQGLRASRFAGTAD